MVEKFNMKQNYMSKHTLVGVVNSEVKDNKVNALVEFLPIHPRTTPSIFLVITLVS